MAHSGRVVLVVALLAMLAVVGAYAIQAAPKKTVAVSLHLNRVHSDAEIEQAFVARSTPGSKLFLEHLSQEELNQLVGAAPSTVDAVTKYLSTLAGVRSVRVSVTNDVVIADIEQDSEAAAAFSQFGGVTLGAARMLQMPVHPVKNPPRQTLPIPSALRAHLRMAIGGVALPKTKKEGKLQGFPGMEQTPQDIMARYKVPTTPKKPTDATYSQAVAEFERSFFKQSDMQTFSTFFKLPVPTIKVNGPNTNSNDDIEGTLDLEYITALNPEVPTWWVSQNSSSTEPGAIDFTWWVDQVLSMSTPPSVTSISWGLGDYRYFDDKEIMTSDNDAFRKLGLRGTTVLAASGDSGPGARRYQSCTKFMPSWPASSPYVTSVGATYATNPSEAEVAVDFSGGGFSNYFDMPSYQKTAVEKYLSTASGLPKSSLYNAKGRGYPDVAALGTNYKIFAPRQAGVSSWWPVSGTSCASPTFASIISRINVERIAKGKKTLGFLNPQLYSLGSVGQDITSGKSADQDCFGIFTIPGFPAVNGWDAITGLGTPNYEFLLNKLG